MAGPKGCALLQTCPLCGAQALAEADQRVDMDEVLRRWEEAATLQFADTVRREYARCTARLYRCSDCGYAPFLPVIEGTPDFYSAITTAGSYYERDKWEFLRAAREIRRRGARSVLDVGCGSGAFLDLLRHRDARITLAGYEHNPSVRDTLLRKGYDVYSGPFAQAFDLPSGRVSFDVICAFQVLEHSGTPRVFLRHMQELLRPGGAIILAVPDAAGPVRHFSDALTDIPPHHVARWERRTFEIGLSRCGFRVVSLAHEPLPSSLWDAYLPRMIEHDFLPAHVGRRLNRQGVTAAIISGLRAAGVRWLHGLRGHSLYAVLEPRMAPKCPTPGGAS